MVENKSLETPILLFSLDTEIAWGFHDKDELPKNRIESARSSLKDILRLFDKYEIPATWAVVGHLFLEECDGKHEDHPLGKEWFERDPGGDVEENPNWFGSDLIKEISDAKVDHEIGCHSFSHIEFDSVSREGIEWELENCLEAAKRMGIDLESFVFPRNRVGHRDLLKKYGFVSYRGNEPPSWYDRLSLQRRGLITNNIRRGGKFLDFTTFRTKPSIVEPVIDDYGLVNIPASLDVYCFEGKAREISEKFIGDPVVSKIKKGLDYITENNGILHLWFHPNNLTQEKDLDRLVKICKYVNRKKEKGSLKVKTMKEVAKETIEGT